MAIVLAHEAAHLWFGCLVEGGWWDDLWLAEAMANYLASLNGALPQADADKLAESIVASTMRSVSAANSAAAVLRRQIRPVAALGRRS